MKHFYSYEQMLQRDLGSNMSQKETEEYLGRDLFMMLEHAFKRSALPMERFINEGLVVGVTSTILHRGKKMKITVTQEQEIES